MEHAMNAMNLQHQMHSAHAHTQQHRRWNVDAPEFVPRAAAPQYYDYSSMYNGYNVADTYQHYPQPVFTRRSLLFIILHFLGVRSGVDERVSRRATRAAGATQRRDRTGDARPAWRHSYGSAGAICVL